MVRTKVPVGSELLAGSTGDGLTQHSAILTEPVDFVIVDRAGVHTATVFPVPL